MKCGNCGKSVRFIEGSWFHTWWVRDGAHGLIPAGPRKWTRTRIKPSASSEG